MASRLLPTSVRTIRGRARSARTTAALALGLTLAAVGCSSGDGSDAASSRPTGSSGSNGGRAAVPYAAVPDVCELVDAETVERLTGVPVAEGSPGASIGANSRCEFTTSTGDGADVAVQVGVEEAADQTLPDSPLLTRAGFEETFADQTATPVEGSDDTFAIIDDTSSVRQIAVLRTDSRRYTLVTVTGFDVPDAAVGGAAALVDEVARLA